MKVLAIVVGSLVGLVLLAVIGIALLAPVVGKAIFANSQDPAKQRTTAAKIAEFATPAGFRVASAMDFGITQSVTIMPIDRSKYSLILQVTSQHIPAADTKTVLDQLVTSTSFAEKMRGCDLKEDASEIVDVRGKPTTLRSLSCARTSTPLRVEVGFVSAKASMVQLVANDVRSRADHDALVAFLKSIR